MSESWKTSPDPRYEVSSTGRVRHAPTGRIRQLRLHLGYPTVTVGVGLGKSRVRYVHRWVCEAFHGPPPSKRHEVRHLNGNRSDNRPENLTWGTRRQNMLDKAAHGTMQEGERHYGSKLTSDQVVELRELAANGATYRYLANRYGLQLGSARDIATGKTWRSVGGPLAGRRYLSASDDARILRELEASGMTQKAFAASKGMPVGTLEFALRRARRAA